MEALGKLQPWREHGKRSSGSKGECSKNAGKPRIFIFEVFAMESAGTESPWRDYNLGFVRKSLGSPWKTVRRWI
jgi:hypothetical protein